ncbi:patatin-like phospholipase family protein [Pyxidicoccus fallax]|uniref:Patatin-like phospholipase family protein n=1 Tax=Pyxidicoccus fallax TaxID=394095 RepID=A0A848M063_9BACT|nr:patatin-like phospholipase family protein [Pyxidicoccus fallax]NMO23261.1 patatin-like phospholipase family protein [Pyxidicoccus fallax]NPC86149.1 patatin-like phospholipase family protein [Pyxidicoccus fallax]
MQVLGSKASRHQERRCDLVFEGGGVKGIGLAGAFSVLEERGYTPQNLAGSSAGAITAALVAAGYRSDELRKLVLDLDFRQFQDKGWEDKVPLIGKALSLLRDQGIYEGRRLCEWLDSMLEPKGVRTFADLRTEWDDPRWSFKLQVTVSDLTSRRLLVLPRDAHLLGLDPLTLKVSDAVRMSMSIPVFFEPVRLMNPQTNREHLLVDGGILSNFPVWLFDSVGEEPDWPTFGLMLVEPEPKPLEDGMPVRGPRGLRGLRSLVLGLTQTLLEAHDRLYLERAQFARTITIPTQGVGTTEFNLERERAMKLYESGRAGAEQFLASWDFDAYLKEFRGDKPHNRRESVREELAAVRVSA